MLSIYTYIAVVNAHICDNIYTKKSAYKYLWELEINY